MDMELPAKWEYFFLHVSRDQSDHSTVIGWTTCALLMVSKLGSDSPMYLNLPLLYWLFQICPMPNQTFPEWDIKFTYCNEFEAFVSERYLQFPLLAQKYRLDVEGKDQHSTHQDVLSWLHSKHGRIQVYHWLQFLQHHCSWYQCQIL